MNAQIVAKVIGTPVAGFDQSDGHRVAHVQLDASPLVADRVSLTAHRDVDAWLALPDGAEVSLEGQFDGDTWLDAKLRRL